MMIWSGILIYWANAVFSIKIFGYELFHFFPAWFYEFLGVPFPSRRRLAASFLFYVAVFDKRRRVCFVSDNFG